MTEGRLLAHEGLHAPHARRVVVAFDVELAIDGELAVVTVRAQIPGAREFHLAQGGENGARAEFAIARLMAAWAGQRTLFGIGLGELQ